MNAMGEAATAGPVGDDGHTHEHACLNCAAPLTGPHCAQCGQAAHIHKTIGAFFHDLLHGVFHFEGKIWRTLPMLAWRPGRLTREYIDGRRASYVSPIALFLFCVFLLFTTINTVVPPIDTQVGTSIEQAEAAQQAEITELTDARKAAAGDPALMARIDAGLVEARENLAAIRQLKASGVTVSNVAADRFKTASDIAWIDTAVKKAQANPQLALYKVQSYSYKYSWALIPISVPFLWLLFPFSRRFGIYDHTVFVTYSMCFMTLLAVTATIVGQFAPGPAATAASLAAPWHMYRQLRGAYALRRRSALWRTAALCVFAFLALVLFSFFLIYEAA